MRDMYYNVDAVNTINLDALKGTTSVAKSGTSAASKGSAVPYAAIGDAIGTIISSIAGASAQEKMARLQEATGMAELRWADENEKFYRSLATASQKRDYMMKVVVEQIKQKRAREGGEKDRKFRNVILITVSLIALGVAIPLMVKYSKK
tara:strand:+ start:2837 stop:3283 length:447 start_codon:yes stop_codon:yes gene_type:complete